MMVNDKNGSKSSKDNWKTRIKNQTLSGIMLVPTFGKLLALYCVMSFLLLLIGIIMLVMANNVNTIEIRYDDQCSVGVSDCNITFTPDTTLSEPKLYYKLDNFYGNHRNYLKSRSFVQLRGKTGESVSYCTPIKENEDVADPLYNLNGDMLDKDDTANPCGLIAKYHFTDSFMLYTGATSNQIDIDEDDISHSIDRNSRFKRPDDYMEIQWTDTEDEHLMVWYQADAFPSFIKLWGKIKEDLEEGVQYRIQINNQWDDSEFDTAKYVFISETNAFGGDNITFGVLYIVAGCVLFLLSVVMIGLEIHQRIKNRKQVHDSGH